MQRGLITFLLLIFFLTPTHEKNITGNTVPMEKDKIIYVFDPMCGWCFGFGKVMEEFHAQYKDSLYFNVISGGMVVGEREGSIGDFADYILGAYTKVEEYSGLKFGEAYLDQLKTKNIWSSSVKPAIAIETFKTFNTIDVVDFSHKVQKAYYVDGKDLRDDKVYTDLIKPYAIDEHQFISKLNSDEMKKITFDWFKTTSDWGVSGYPTVIQVHKGKYYAIARGYTDINTLVNNAQSVLVKE